MPRIKIEWVPIKKWNLGCFGFDHLHLVYQPGAHRSENSQADWWVLEGTRDKYPNSPNAVLGINGVNGRTSLAESNPVSTASGEKLPTERQLVEQIGTPQTRGSLTLAFTNARKAWKTMCSYAYQFECQKLPYICLGLSPTGPPTINSASVIASLLYYRGIKIGANLPRGLRFSPGMKTLIGLPGQFEDKIPEGFNAVVTRKNATMIHGKRYSPRPQKTILTLTAQTEAWYVDFNGVQISKKSVQEDRSRRAINFEYNFPIPTETHCSLTPRILKGNTLVSAAPAKSFPEDTTLQEP